MSIRRYLLGRAMNIAFLLTRPMTLGARIAAFDDEGRVLLVKHGYLPGWHFPGGGVDPGESAEQAAVRELREEANVEVADRPTLHGVFFNRRSSRRDHVVVYVARGVLQTAPRAANWEISAAAFFKTTDLPEGVSSAVVERLREIQGLAKPAQFW
jgi:8-oxo-dGTP pyrophosphatase MutT (NUDIX family)